MHQEVHSLAFHSNGSISYMDAYNMPIWLRRYNIKLINEHNKKQSKDQEEAMKKAKGKRSR